MELSETHKNQYLVYNRKSTDDPDNQRNSLEYQKQQSLEYAKRLGLPVAALTIPGFCERGVVNESHSAFKQDDEFFISPDGLVQYRVLRPKFFKLSELLKDRKIKGAIFLCWDRASRNEQDDLILKKLTKLGCDIRFVEATYEDSSAGEFHRAMDGVFAAHTSRTISEKVRNVQRKLRNERRCLYNAPIGYLDRGSDSKPLDSERAPLVKRLFELYATGNWSISQLAKWGREHGLTKRPARRKRTREEIANNVGKETIPKVARPLDHMTVGRILTNPFYVGKVKIADKQYENSTAHQALIDNALFFDVQHLLKKRRVSVYYVDRLFHTYRGFVRCACGRSYSPYVQKGIVYYRSRCMESCVNRDPNLKELEINRTVQGLLQRAYLTEDERKCLERHSKASLPVIEERRDQRMADLRGKERNVLADLDYLTDNKITLLRTGVMTIDAFRQEEERLAVKLRAIGEEVRAYAESVPEMLRCIFEFSDAARMMGAYFENALDSERREIMSVSFGNLTFKERQLTDYVARDGFDALLKRTRARRPGQTATERENGEDPYLYVLFWTTGGADVPFSELPNIYRAAKASLEKLNNLPFLGKRISPKNNLH